MQVQPANYTKSIQAQTHYNLAQSASASSSSKSGDKVSISDEAKALAEKMQESQDTDLPLEEYRLPKWYAEYMPPCMEVECRLGESADMQKEMFRRQHDSEIGEYYDMLSSAYSEICEKYDISKYSDYSKYSTSEIEDEFRNILSKNTGVEDLMETLNVSKKL